MSTLCMFRCCNCCSFQHTLQAKIMWNVNITDSTSVNAGTSITVYNQGRCTVTVSWSQYNFFWYNTIFSWRAIKLLNNTYSCARIFFARALSSRNTSSKSSHHMSFVTYFCSGKLVTANHFYLVNHVIEA